MRQFTSRAAELQKKYIGQLAKLKEITSKSAASLKYGKQTQLQILTYVLPTTKQILECLAIFLDLELRHYHPTHSELFEVFSQRYHILIKFCESFQLDNRLT